MEEVAMDQNTVTMENDTCPMEHKTGNFENKNEKVENRYIEVQDDQYHHYQNIMIESRLSCVDLMHHFFNLYKCDLKIVESEPAMSKPTHEVGVQCVIEVERKSLDHPKLRNKIKNNLMQEEKDGNKVLLTLPENVLAKDLTINISHKLHSPPSKLQNETKHSHNTRSSNRRFPRKVCRKNYFEDDDSDMYDEEEYSTISYTKYEPKDKKNKANAETSKLTHDNGMTLSDKQQIGTFVDDPSTELSAIKTEPTTHTSAGEDSQSDGRETEENSNYPEIVIPPFCPKGEESLASVGGMCTIQASTNEEGQDMFVTKVWHGQQLDVKEQDPFDNIDISEDVKSFIDKTSKNVTDKAMNISKESVTMVAGEAVYSCSFCSYTSRYAQGLRRHVMLHTGKEFKCKHCTKSYTEKSKLIEHVKVKHEKSLIYPCKRCHKEFKSSRGLVYHNVTFHEQRGTTLQCQFCEKAFSSKYGFVYHTKTVHGEVKVAENIKKVGDAFKPFTKWEKKTKMKQKNQKDRNGFYHCQEADCDYKSPQMFHIRRHSSVHTGHQFKCEHCRKTFSENYKLKMHLQVKHGTLRYSCELCSKEFGTKQGLKYHKLSGHGGEPKFVCEECGQKFYSKCMYEGHMNKHKGVKPFSCRDCDKRFYYQTEISVHKKYCGIDRTPKEKPDKYICHICGDEFKKKQILTEHVNGRHGVVGNYNCICGANFKWRNSLRSHKMKCAMWISEHGDTLNQIPKPPKNTRRKKSQTASSSSLLDLSSAIATDLSSSIANNLSSAIATDLSSSGMARDFSSSSSYMFPDSLPKADSQMVECRPPAHPNHPPPPPLTPYMGPNMGYLQSLNMMHAQGAYNPNNMYM